MSKYTLFREKYPTFFYHNYEITETDTAISIVYRFSIAGLSDFAPSWTFQKNGKETLATDSPTFRRLAFCLGMAELVSYWKIACPGEIKILCGALTGEEILWWKKQYFLGLGEFFYRNGIDADFDSFCHISAEGDSYTPMALPNLKGCLIPIGGGKDSAATVSLIPNKADNLCYLLNPRGSMTLTAATAGYAENQRITPRRTLDKNMLRLNSEGYLNGHTPFSAVIAFSGLLIAALYGKKYVVLSNESSANESTVAGTDVNHQYSKSFQFEADFVDYQQRFLGAGVHYFSLLRPWSEIQIAAYFAGLKDYHPFFKSCNAGSKTDSWCCNCSKCLFIFLILAPFLTEKEMLSIFGEDLSDKDAMLPLMEQLIGMTEEKPFECVGSREEVNFALCMAIARKEKAGLPLTKLYSAYKESEFYKEYSAKPVPYGGLYNEENLLPVKFDELLRKVTKEEAAKW